MHPKIKICGLMRPCDIDAVNSAKPEYIGFVFADSRLKISPSQADELRKRLSPDIVPVGVFVNESIEEIVWLIRNGIIDAAQLHGDESEEYIEALKSRTDKPVIKAVAVLEAGDVQKWTDTCADYILLDNKGGATGKPFDWNLIGEVHREFFLAGGLNTLNIRSAVEKAAPYAVDISTGVETNGMKDNEKITAIVRRIRDE